MSERGAPERCRAWIDHLEVIPIGGDRCSTIELPHIAVVADVLRAARL